MVESNADTLLKGKATQQSNETEANPYNSKKDYIDYEQREANAKEPFADAKTIAVKKDQPKVVVDSMQSTETEEDTPEEQADKPYQKVDYKKRYDDLKKHYDGRVNSFKSREEELLAEIRSNRPKYKAPKSAEEIEAFKKEYPDVYDAVKQIAYEQADEKSKEVNSKLTELEKRQAEVLRQKAEVELARAHPDFSALRESQDFHDWASTQDSTIQSWLYDNVDNSKLVIRAIDLYKMDRGMTDKPAPKSKNNDAAKAVTKTKSGDQKTEKKTWKLSDIQKMKPFEFDKYEKEIDLARKEGRIVQG